MEQVRLGIIGLGNMGTCHVETIQKGDVPEVCITAVADRREVRRAWARENVPGAAVFEEGSDLIHSGLCDAVMVVVPHYQHPGLSIEALQAGLHVLCEKPAGVYTKQVREMNEVASASDKTFAIMFNQRTNPAYQKIHDMVNSGELGALKRVNWIVTDWYRTQIYYDSGSWRATWKGEGGGVLLNQCPHQLDLLQWICGLPVKVQAFCHEGKWHDIEVEDDVTAYMEFANGATTTRSCTVWTAWPSMPRSITWCCCTRMKRKFTATSRPAAWRSCRSFTATASRQCSTLPTLCSAARIPGKPGK